MRFAPALLITALLSLSACNREKDFDKQYAETEKQLQEEAKRLDTEMTRAKAVEPGEKLPAKKAH